MLQHQFCPPQAVTPYTASTLRLPCVAESELSTTITWLKNGVGVLPVNARVLQSGTLVIENIKKTKKGSYICRASNALATIEAKVKITPAVPSCSEVKKIHQQCKRKLRH